MLTVIFYLSSPCELVSVKVATFLHFFLNFVNDMVRERIVAQTGKLPDFEHTEDVVQLSS